MDKTQRSCFKENQLWGEVSMYDTRPHINSSSGFGFRLLMKFVLHVERAVLGATLCSISVALVVPGQKLLAVSWLEGELERRSRVVHRPGSLQ
jgi:hypothetical protein